MVVQIRIFSVVPHLDDAPAAGQLGDSSLTPASQAATSANAPIMADLNFTTLSLLSDSPGLRDANVVGALLLNVPWPGLPATRPECSA